MAGGRPKNYQHVYVVLRIDEGDGENGADDRITVKEVLTTIAEAEREVERLNKINGDKDCWYCWEQSRYFPDGSSFGSPGAEEGNPNE